MGELLVYTNRLTDVERRQTMDYLMKRWKSGVETKPFDADAVIIGKAGAAVNVNAGDTAKIRTVRLGNNVKASGSVVKKGAGTLEIEEVMPSGATIEVQGGDILLSHDTPAASTAVADVPTDMACWLDAENSTIEGTDAAVVKWFDLRADKKDSVWAEVYSTQDDAKPARVADAESGLHVIDYGKDAGATHPCGVIKVNGSSLKGVKDMFVVFRRNGTGYALLWDGGRSGSIRTSNSTIISDGFNYNSTMGSNWSVDGEPRDTLSTTIADFSDAGNRRLSVVGMTSSVSDGASYCYLGLSQWDCGTSRGGIVYGEVICYTRKLTDAERRNVTAYLMNKWQNGAKLPLDDDDTVARIAFADGVAPTVGTRTDRTVSSISGKGTLTKTGAGKLTASSVDATVTNLNVATGTLKTSVNWLADAVFHVDASDATSFEYVSGSATKVSRWYDVRKNGLYAEAYFLPSATNASGVITMDYPERITSHSETTLKADMPYVDFHRLSPTYFDGCSAMRWYKADGTRLGPTNLREVHLVYMDDTVSINNIGAPTQLSWSENNWTYAVYGGFMRSGVTTTYYYNGTGNKTQFSTNLIDDVRFDNNVYNSKTNPGFHVQSVLTTAGTAANSFFVNRDYKGETGGGRLCEVIVFDKVTSSNHWMQVHQYLQKKWKDIGEGGGLPALNEVNVAAGATAELANLTGGAVELKSLTGAGTLKASSVKGVGRLGGVTVDGDLVPADPFTLDIAMADEETCDCLTVKGAFTAPAAATVNLTVPDGFRGTGTRQILKYASLVGDIDLSQWSLNVSGETRRLFRLRQGADGVYLGIEKRGLTVIVR